MENDFTTVRLLKRQLRWLDTFKFHPRQAYHEVIDLLKIKVEEDTKKIPLDNPNIEFKDSPHE